MVMNLGGNQFNTKKAPIWSFCFFLVDSCAWIKNLTWRIYHECHKFHGFSPTNLDVFWSWWMFFTLRNFGIPLGFITVNFTHPFASRLFQAPKKNTNPTRKRVTTEPKRRPRFAFAMAKMIKPKRPDGFLKSIFFSKTFLTSSTSLLGLFFNGLAQFSMIFCQTLPYLGDFVASFCLTKGGNGKGGNMF